MQILVTGAAGHLGTHLVAALAERGDTLTGVDMVSPATPIAGVRYFQADLSDDTAIRPLLDGTDVLIHGASIHPWKPYSDDQYIDANIKGTWHIYDIAAKCGVDNVVLTSSIAACGYPTSIESWPIHEDQQWPLADMYCFTKHAQEDIARMHADRGHIRTIALRPPAFMPLPTLETGFSLTGAFGVVGDMVRAHIAALDVLTGAQKPDEPIGNFEAIFVTNRHPYSAADADVYGASHDVKPLVQKHFPAQYEWLIANGYTGAWVPASYNIGKAKRILNWEPQYGFEEWFAEHAR